jgi:hypothetical protein
VRVKPVSCVEAISGRFPSNLLFLNRLEEECDTFSGTTDEETILLEKIKFQHELLDTERKVSQIVVRPIERDALTFDR